MNCDIFYDFFMKEHLFWCSLEASLIAKFESVQEILVHITLSSSKFLDAQMFVCFVALRPKSTSKVMARQSPNHTFSWGIIQCFVHMLSLVTDNNPS